MTRPSAALPLAPVEFIDAAVVIKEPQLGTDRESQRGGVMSVREERRVTRGSVTVSAVTPSVVRRVSIRLFAAS